MGRALRQVGCAVFVFLPVFLLFVGIWQASVSGLGVADFGRAVLLYIGMLFHAVFGAGVATVLEHLLLRVPAVGDKRLGPPAAAVSVPAWMALLGGAAGSYVRGFAWAAFIAALVSAYVMWRFILRKRSSE